MTRTYTCDECQGTFESSWTEAEALEEMKANGFGDLPKEEMAQVCDDCYKRIMGSPSPPLTQFEEEVCRELGKRMARPFIEGTGSPETPGGLLS